MAMKKTEDKTDELKTPEQWMTTESPSELEKSIQSCETAMRIINRSIEIAGGKGIPISQGYLIENQARVDIYFINLEKAFLTGLEDDSITPKGNWFNQFEMIAVNGIDKGTERKNSPFEKNELTEYIISKFTSLKNTIASCRKIHTENIRRNKNNAPLSQDKNNVSYNLIELNYTPVQQVEIIQFLFDELNQKLFNTSYEIFVRHFIEGESILEKIIWIGTEQQIKALFKWLDEKQIIITTDINILIKNHFVNKKRREFKCKQLSVVLSKSDYSFDNLKIIPPLTKKLEKLVLTFN